MTRMIRFKFRRLVVVAALGAGALGLAVGTASASPSGDPTPNPTASAPLGYSLPGQGHDERFRPEAFDILVASVPTGTGTNNVDAYGPVDGLGGTDTELAPFAARWTFSDQGTTDTVNVIHQAEPAPVLDVSTCTATVTQRGGWWKFAGGTGDETGAKGHGLFDLVALFSFPIDRHGRCEFDSQGRMMDEGQQGNYGNDPVMEDHGRELRPLFFSVEVQGTGVAKVRHHEEPRPEPCPTETYGASGFPVSCPAPTPIYS